MQDIQSVYIIPKKINSHTVLCYNTLPQLNTEIERKLNDGWQLYGNLIVEKNEHESSNHLYYQSMVWSKNDVSVKLVNKDRVLNS